MNRISSLLKKTMTLLGRSKVGRSESSFQNGVQKMTEDQNWREKLAQKFWAVKIGERAENLRQTAKRFNNVHSLTMATREKLLGKDITENNRPEDENMHIGDDNRTIHQYLPEQKKSGGGLAKLALGAGLLATGVGVPVGGWLVAEAIRDANKPAPAAPTETVDENTEYDFLFDLVK